MTQKQTSVWLLIMNKTTKRSFFRYFETEYEKDKYKDRLKWIPNLYVIEDSSDMYWGYN